MTNSTQSILTHLRPSVTWKADNEKKKKKKKEAGKGKEIKIGKWVN